MHAGRPEAGAAIWNWRREDASASPVPAARNPRLIGTIQALGSAAFGVLIYLFWSQTVATVVLSIAGIILFSALVSPTGLYRAIQGVFTALGNATGRALTWVMLVPLFYLFFLPFGMVMRRGRRDRLQRYFEDERESYWEPHGAFTSGDHERQF